MKYGVLITAVVLSLGMGRPAGAFHDGGVARCEGCHSMSSGNARMLEGSDPSSTCLNCHGPRSGVTGGYHVMSTYIEGTGPANLTPGGDFGWLTKTFTFVDGGILRSSDGENHGHNIVSMDDGLASVGGLSPGGAYPADGFSCISCHDPHGEARRLSADGTNIGYRGSGPIVESGSYGAVPAPGGAVGAYRLLGGVNYQSAYYGAPPVFTADPPSAVAPSSYNRAQTDADTRVAYGKGMSAWCGNCHSNYVTNEHSAFEHPSGNIEHLGDERTSRYNAYVKTGDLSGTRATAWTELVPFALTTADYTVLNASVATYEGPVSADAVFCLSCHRAHASGWDNMMRWNPNLDGLVVDGLYIAAEGRTYEETQTAYHGKPETRFASSKTTSASPYQGSLCNKCHAFE